MPHTFIPGAYDNTEQTWASIVAQEPFNAVILFDRARVFTNNVRQLNPKALIIHRIQLDGIMTDLLNEGYNGGVRAAQMVFDPDADAFIGLNEPPCGNSYEAERVAHFDAGFTDYLAERNKIALIGGFGSGYPEFDVLAYYFIVFKDTVSRSNNIVFHFHAYGPNMLNEPSQISDLMGISSKWNALRYQELWEPIEYPIIISEIGPNGYRPDINPPGWKGVHTEQEVLDDSRWFMQNAMSILGASPYCDGDSGAGASQPGEVSWENFNENGCEVLLSGRQQWNALNYDDVEWKDIIMSWGEDMTNDPLAHPPTTDEERAKFVEYLQKEFGEYKTYWEGVGGLEDNLLTHLVAIGKFPVSSTEWHYFLREKIISRRDSAEAELRDFDEQYGTI